jgi:hypothetical protein
MGSPFANSSHIFWKFLLGALQEFFTLNPCKDLHSFSGPSLRNNNPFSSLSMKIVVDVHEEP